MNLLLGESLAAGRTTLLLCDGSMDARVAEDMAAGGDHHLGAPLLKHQGRLHADGAFDQALCRTARLGFTRCCSDLRAVCIGHTSMTHTHTVSPLWVWRL